MAAEFRLSDKPAGLTTHSSLNESDRRKPWADCNDGFMEWLAEQSGVGRLFPVHRLDRETTGALLFATTSVAAEKARVWFENREVEKEYLLVTDRQPSDSPDSFTAESYIERIGNEYVSKKVSPTNAQTSFEKIKTYGRFSLWRAKPATGKSHQIRLHAEDHGIPLLGDATHGGSEFPVLCLHSLSLKLPGSEEFRSPAPLYFEDLSLLEDRTLVRWLAAVDRRERVLRSLAKSPQTDTTIRWIHTEGDPLRLEQLGEVCHLNWFSETLPSEREWSSIERLLKLKNWSSWYLQLRSDRGKDPVTDRALNSTPPPPNRWTAQENDLTYEFRRDTGLSPGLFLDQRRNRAWLRGSVTPESRVLNLFGYTGGFSVAAAAGGAKTVSVDVSKTFLDWSKRNFELNGLSLEGHEFRSIDSGEYLAWAHKKGLKFDFVVCDPPSFARTNTRGKSSVFRIENEFSDLLTACLNVTNPGGTILFSTNYEQWTPDEFGQRTERTIADCRIPAAVRQTPSPGLDFELPRAYRHMKSLLIHVSKS